MQNPPPGVRTEGLINPDMRGGGENRGERMIEVGKCPLLSRHTGKELLAQDCLAEYCELWMTASQRCAIRHIAHELSKQG